MISHAARRRWVALAVAGALGSAVGGRARADTTTADRAIAERLYDRGRGQMEQGQVAAACDSFAESQRLDPATGTLLNLAACHEAQGKLASAWVEFREAVAAARREKRPDRVRYAQDHLTAIEPRLGYLTIVIGESTHGQAPVITLDGRVLGPAVWGIAIPIDAGWHEAVAAFGPDKSWRATVNIRDGQRRKLQVPERTAIVSSPIADREDSAVVPIVAAVPVPPPPDEGAVSERRPGRRIAALIVGAAGLAAVGVGSYYAWSASDLWSQRNRECPMESCSAQGVSLGGRADSAATMATWTIGGGLVALGVSALLLFWPRGAPVATGTHASRETAGRLLPVVHLAPSGPLSLRGTF
ncbi:MAG TPA: hypothetical protein VLT58_02280 [Polyangia bacterium]|nr:hypothetical protein [Polyangia bacterium]